MTDTPAFSTENSYLVSTLHGMTLRDYFAAKAMQGMMNDPNIDMPCGEVARLAYKMADAMMKAREE